MEHYNGKRWSEVTVPGGGLTVVLDLGPRTVWALADTTLLQYNGSAWNSAASQPTSPDTLTGSSADSVWTISSTAGGPVAEHWNGTTWTQVGAPNPNVGLRDNAEASLSTLWTVGSTLGSGSLTSQPYIADNGVQVATPSVPGSASLSGVGTGSGHAFCSRV